MQESGKTIVTLDSEDVYQQLSDNARRHAENLLP